MTTITVTVANLSSNSTEAQVVTVNRPSTVREVLAEAGITLAEGQKAQFNGNDITVDGEISSNGFLSISGEAKAA